MTRNRYAPSTFRYAGIVYKAVWIKKTENKSQISQSSRGPSSCKDLVVSSPSSSPSKVSLRRSIEIKRCARRESENGKREEPMIAGILV